MINTNGIVDLSDIFVPLSETPAYEKVLSEKFAKPKTKRSIWMKMRRFKSKPSLQNSIFLKNFKMS